MDSKITGTRIAGSWSTTPPTGALVALDGVTAETYTVAGDILRAAREGVYAVVPQAVGAIAVMPGGRLELLVTVDADDLAVFHKGRVHREAIRAVRRALHRVPEQWTAATAKKGEH